MLLSFLLISGVFGKGNISKLEVDLEFPSEVYARKRFPIKVTLKNKHKFLPAFLIRVVLEGQDILFPFVDRRGEATAYLNLSFDSRGRRQLDGGYVSSVFPFSFIIRYRRNYMHYDFIVFPEPKKCEFLSFYDKKSRSRGDDSAPRPGYEGEVVSVRDYRPGDPLKYINWKATAKTDTLKTKELASLAHQPITINFDEINIKDIEAKISCITHIILQFIRKNIPIGLKIGNKFYQPNTSLRHKIEMLTELALW